MMVVRRACSTALFACVLLLAAPAFAQDDGAIDLFEDAEQSADEDSEEEESEGEEESDENDTEEAELASEDDESNSEADSEPQTDDEAPPASPPPRGEQTEDEPESAQAESQSETGQPDNGRSDSARQSDEPDQAQSDGGPGADESPPADSGAAIAPAYADPDSNVRVIGNLEEGDRWALELGGYIRSGFTQIQNDEDHEIYGRNDGFVMTDARLTTRGEMDNGLGFVFTVDAGSRLIRTDEDSPVEQLALQMTDTYVYYAPFEYLEFNLGQFKAPYDAEDLISTADLLFINRSVANRGVRGIEGFNVRGMTQDRQIGLQARGKYPFTDGERAPAVSYAAMIGNGNGPNRSRNENERLAYYGRLAFHYGEMIAVGGSAFQNNGTFGSPPSQVDRNLTGLSGDLQLDIAGFTFFGNVLTQTRSVPDIDTQPETTGLGYQAQLAYEEPVVGLQPTYRFAYYDRTYGEDSDEDEEDGFFDNDALTYHTLGLNYNADAYPLRLMANYTIAMEEEAGRQIDNNRLDLLVQLQW